jgi:hypothetical protein
MFHSWREPHLTLGIITLRGLSAAQLNADRESTESLSCIASWYRQETENAQACTQSLTAGRNPNTFVIPDDITKNPVAIREKLKLLADTRLIYIILQHNKQRPAITRSLAYIPFFSPKNCKHGSLSTWRGMARTNQISTRGLLLPSFRPCHGRPALPGLT